VLRVVLRIAVSALPLLGLGISPARALSREAQEFIDISAKLEPLQCERRKLRREIALAQAERRDSAELRARFAALDRDPRTASLEKRLAALQPRVSRSSDPEDLAAISRQHTEAFYRCE
jgi:hypothetical protein